MPGLRINIGGGSSLGTSASGSRLGQSTPATIAQVAYGGGASPSNSSDGVQYHHVFVGSYAALIAWEIFVRHSLPGGMKKTFDLIMMAGLPIPAFYAGAGILARKQLAFGPGTGVAHGAARLVKGLTP